MSQRVGIFLSSLEGGGAHKNMIHIANYLSGAGYAVDLVVATADYELVDFVDPSVQIIELNSRSVYTSTVDLFQYCRHYKPHAVVATPFSCNLVAGFIDCLGYFDTKFTLRVPTTLSKERFFNTKHLVKQQTMRRISSFIYGRSDSIIAISTGVKADLVRHFSVDPADTTVIYNPVLTDDVYALMDEKVEHPFFDSAQPVYIAAGRFSTQKNFAYLVRAFATAHEALEAKLIILGEGEKRSELEQLAVQLGIREHVSFPGFVDNPFKYFRRADVFVLSSQWEGFGNVIVEALACGTKVLATDCQSGPSEILADGTYGMLAPMDNVSAFSEMLLDILDSNYDPKALQQRAEQFHIDTIGPAYESYITE